MFSKSAFFIFMYTACNVFYPLDAKLDMSSTLSDWILQGHVIHTFNFTTLFGCFLKCSDTYNCYSLNFYPATGLCELNNATNSSHPHDLVPSKSHGIYFLNSFHAMPCSDAFCILAGPDKKCFWEDGKTKVCKG